MATCIHRMVGPLSSWSTAFTRSRSPTLTPPLETMASQRLPASSSRVVRAASSSLATPRSTVPKPSAWSWARSAGRLASRIFPGARVPLDVASSSPVETTPTVGRGWTRTRSAPMLDENAHVSCAQRGPGGEHLVTRTYVPPGLSYERPGLHRFLDDDDRSARFEAGALDHAHGVGSRRQRCPRHDPDRLTGGHERPRVVPGHHGGHDPKGHGRRRRIRSPQGIAVHRRIGEGWDIRRGQDALGQNVAVGVVDVQLNGVEDLAGREDEQACLGDRDHGPGGIRVSGTGPTLGCRCPKTKRVTPLMPTDGTPLHGAAGPFLLRAVLAPTRATRRRGRLA